MGARCFRVLRLTLLWRRFLWLFSPPPRRATTLRGVTTWERTVIYESLEIFRNSSRSSNPWRNCGSALPACRRGRNDEQIGRASCRERVQILEVIERLQKYK